MYRSFRLTSHRAPDATDRAKRCVGIVGLLVVASLLAGAPAFAAKGPGKPTSGSSSLQLVLLDSPDGLPHWGEQVTFDVATTATTQPHVSLACYQAGALVYTTQTGYYASYPWPWTQTMTLSSAAWTGGGADCKATLYYFSGSKTVTAAVLGFTVYA